MNQSQTEQSPADTAQQELETAQLRARMADIGRKILVLSGKGGVGKSTVAANLAVSLARAGKTVGLLDVDLHGPSIPKILGLEGQRHAPSPSGGLAPIRVNGALSVVSIGLLLDSGTDAVIWRGPMKYHVIRQFLKDAEWGRLDFLVIDAPPGTGDEPLAVAQLVGQGAEAVVVTTPQQLAIADVRRSVSFCHKLDLHLLGIVENMSGLTCPHCGQHVDLFPPGGGERLAAEVGAALLGRIPLDPQIAASGDGGKPFVLADDSPAVQAFAAILQTILSDPSPSAPGPTAGAPGSGPAPHAKETHAMKIAIPTADGLLCMHFGHCQQFALLNVDAESKTVGEVEYLTPPAHEPGVLPRWLHEQGAEVIIAGGMGRRAQGLFDEHGIRVVVGAPAEDPEAVAAAYLAGTLEAGQNLCDH